MDFKALARSVELDEEEYLDFIRLFIQVSKSDLDILLRAIKEGCTETASAAAHSIRGASGNLRLINLHDTSKKIEEKSRQGILEGVPKLAHLLTEELHRLGELVDNEVKNLVDSGLGVHTEAKR